MIDVYTMNLENGQKYMILDTLVLNNQNYLLFVNENDNSDIRIKKVIVEDNKEVVINIESPQELNEVLIGFDKKRKGEK